MKSKLANKKILIAGGAQGLGYFMAREFLNQGAFVAVTSRFSTPLEKVSRDFCIFAERFFTLQVDQFDDDAVSEGVDGVLENMGGIDFFVNNIGRSYYGCLEDLPSKKLIEAFTVNVQAGHAFTRAVLPLMRKQASGTIVQIISSAGLRGFPNRGAYSAAKFALSGLTESLRSELTPIGIRVIAVYPGAIATNFFENEEILVGQGSGKMDQKPMEPELVARRIASGMANGKERIIFPNRVRILHFLNSIFPSVADKIISKQL